MADNSHKYGLKVIFTNISFFFSNYLSSAWQAAFYFSKSMPLLSIFLPSLIIGTTVAMLLNALIPYHDGNKTSYNVMSEFFKKRQVIEISSHREISRLDTHDINKDAIHFLSPNINISPGIHRVTIKYSEKTTGANTLENLVLKSNSSPQNEAIILATSILQNAKQISLEFQSKSSDIQIQLTRSNTAKGMKWPRAIITIEKDPNG